SRKNNTGQGALGTDHRQVRVRPVHPLARVAKCTDSRTHQFIVKSPLLSQETDPMLWLKAFHLIFVVCWFAGIFYLPRLFVYHAMAAEQATRDHLKIMERKLYRFTTPFAVLTLVFGDRKSTRLN